MENINSSKINIINIVILNDFLCYLDFKDIKQVSLLSNLARLKLRPYIFKNLLLADRDYDLNSKNNVFLDYFKFINIFDHDNINHTSLRYYQKGSIESGLGEFAFALNKIKNISQSLVVKNIRIAGFFFFPLINTFINLTVLKLERCFIPYSELSKIGKSLKKLKRLELSLVVLMKSLEGFDVSRNFSFPPELTYLKLCNLEVICIGPISNPCEFLFTKEDQFNPRELFLPEVSIPSLKSLYLFEYSNIKYRSREFVKNNPTLESLAIQSFNFDMVKGLKNLSTLEIDLLANLEGIDQYQTLEYIKKLSIEIAVVDYYEDVKKLCKLCPNLEELHFISIYYEISQSEIDNWLIPILDSFQKLKSFRILISTYEDENLDISKLSSIESLILKSESYTIFNLNFHGCKKLNKIEFSSFTSEINTKSFKSKFNDYDDWMFTFSDYSIKGYKISS
jgi:hypothetical protein